MPAKDKYHDTVIRALEKDGWLIESEQYVLIVENRVLWIDLLISDSDKQETLLVEVKSFTSASQVEDLANAIGKYFLYSAILEDNDAKIPLYLAIPETAYHGIFNEALGQIVMDKLNLSIIVYNPELEVILQWIT